MLSTEGYIMITKMNFYERSLLFAKLAQIAYKDPKAAKKDAAALGFKEIEFYDLGGAQAYRLQNDTDMVIACRGTEPTEFNDIAADLKAMPVMAETVGRVHMGFKKEVDELWPMVKEDLLDKDNSHVKVWFTGHSLGAAMTTIMASRCEDDEEMPNIEEVYTYGSPRVGWRKFVKSLGCKHHRWVNNNDIVTTVPLRVMGYVHDGQEHYMDCNGMERMMTPIQRMKDKLQGYWMGWKNKSIDSFSDHNIGDYISNIEKNMQG